MTVGIWFNRPLVLEEVKGQIGPLRHEDEENEDHFSIKSRSPIHWTGSNINYIIRDIRGLTRLQCTAGNKELKSSVLSNRTNNNIKLFY
jgi:hypothetical protein